MERENGKGAEIRYAFYRTVPVMVGYLFLGAAFGILMSVNGFGAGWAAACSFFIYAGSLQYAGISLLASAAAGPLTALILSLMINARHIFYGISMLGKYRDVKHGKWYLIFGLTDETFSLLCNEEVPATLSRTKVYLWITGLNHFYWVAGTLAGAAAGSFIRFNTKGLDFALTALFIMIFTEQWLSEKSHGAALSGIACSVICLVIFGPDAFIIPAMVLMLGLAGIGYRKERRKCDE